MPLVIGGVVAVLLPAMTGGLWVMLNNQVQGLEQQEVKTRAALQQLQTKTNQITAMQTQIQQVQGNTLAIASVLTQIKPWSALLQDISQRTPVGVELVSVKEAPGTAPAAPPTPTPGTTPPLPTPTLTITGLARSFPQVNQFLLVLQKSPFLQPDQTSLTSAELVANPTKISLGTGVPSGTVVKLPKVVSFQIQTTLTAVGANQLLAALKKDGAVGLVTRIETLGNRIGGQL